MKCFAILLLAAAVSAQNQNPFSPAVKYSVRTNRFDRNFNNLFNYESDVIANNQEANYIQLESNVTNLRRGIFDVTANTLHLLASGRGIRFIQPGAFEGQRFTGQLQLHNNQLQALSKGTFVGLDVYEIDLTNNQIKFVDPGAFENLPLLSVLRLDRNGLTTFNSFSVVNTPNIYYLSLAFNNIRKIKENDLSILKAGSPVVLELNSNQLEDIHPAAFNNVYQFDTLNLTENNLRFLSGELFKAPKYEFLYIRNNGLISMPKEFFQLEHIARADLNGNNFICPTINSLKLFREAVSRNVYFDDKFYCGNTVFQF